jgi:hypothetical protein
MWMDVLLILVTVFPLICARATTSAQTQHRSV